MATKSFDSLATNAADKVKVEESALRSGREDSLRTLRGVKSSMMIDMLKASQAERSPERNVGKT
ncbi:hypothetical protein OWR29_39365 [Actinoplanes sp. Pm04-4]|uniref:Uncharacterized protein n=1 Tax=Paractinoplanes pyxinae TaxID=2997416 RepID=A0ABT4BC82_9ACTN|nr:hypothetical protein [Actinoplanes pyxinae]MCY1144092.1 hypothetical protein [Actinoplanes pyxinae]